MTDDEILRQAALIRSIREEEEQLTGLRAADSVMIRWANPRGHKKSYGSINVSVGLIRRAAEKLLEIEIKKLKKKREGE